MGGVRAGAMAGRRTGHQQVASSIPGHGATAYDDSGQLVHTNVTRRRQFSSLYRVVIRNDPFTHVRLSRPQQPHYQLACDKLCVSFNAPLLHKFALKSQL